MQVGRRDLFRGLGAGALLLSPFVRSAIGHAQGSRPARFIFIYKCFGWYKPTMVPPAGVLPAVLPEVLSPLGNLKSKFILTTGLDNDAVEASDQHSNGRKAVLTGHGPNASQGATSESLDSFIARSLPGSHQNRIAFGTVFANDSFETPCAPQGGGILSPTTSAARLYEQLFGNFIFPSTGPVTGPTPEGESPAILLAKARKSVLDSAVADLNSLRPRLPSEARPRLDQHLQSARDIERDLTALVNGDMTGQPVVTSPQCKSRAFTASEQGLGNQEQPSLVKQLSALQISVLTLAAACDRARVLGLSYPSVNGEFYTFLGSDYGGYHEATSHQKVAGWQTRHTKVDAWHIEEAARLASALDAIPEQGGTALDNTVIIMVSDIADGPSHSRNGMVFPIFGGKNLGFTGHGKHIALSGSHTRLLTTIARAMGRGNGVNALANLDHFGNEQFRNSSAPSRVLNEIWS